MTPKASAGARGYKLAVVLLKLWKRPLRIWTSCAIAPLVRSNVDFILIGGMAAIQHGSECVTFDVDLVYLRKEKNIERIARALALYKPYLREASPGLPFAWD